MRSGSNHYFTNLSASTTFTTKGGWFGYVLHATFGGGSVQLNVRADDGVTWVAAAAAWTADATGTLMLPPGEYQIAIVTATAVYISFRRVPGE